MRIFGIKLAKSNFKNFNQINTIAIFNEQIKLATKNILDSFNIRAVNFDNLNQTNINNAQKRVQKTEEVYKTIEEKLSTFYEKMDCKLQLNESLNKINKKLYVLNNR